MMGKDMGSMDTMGGMRHKMMNKMVGEHMGDADVNPEMQAEIDTIKAKYEDDLQAKEKVIDAKMAELDKAWANESTTVGEINLIQASLQALKKEYQQVQIKMNQEIGAQIGTNRMEDGGKRHMMHKKQCDGYCAGKCDGKLCGEKACDGKACAGKAGGHGPMMHRSM